MELNMSAYWVAILWIIYKCTIVKLTEWQTDKVGDPPSEAQISGEYVEIVSLSKGIFVVKTPVFGSMLNSVVRSTE